MEWDNFDLPIDFSSFLDGFFEDIEKEGFPYLVTSTEEKRCKGCNSTFEDILNRGKFGCPTCYETFETQIDNLLNKIHGSNRHVGRIGTFNVDKTNEKINNKCNDDSLVKNKDSLNINKEKSDASKNKEMSKEEKIEELKAKLKELVSQEKYEEAAKVRDEIKKEEN